MPGSYSPVQASAGRPHPLGASVTPDGVNFSLYSEHATSMELLLFDDPADPHPSQVIPMTREDNNTFHFWHLFVPGLRPGTGYGYRVSGPDTTEDRQRYGHRFDPTKVLLDPYALAVETRLWDREVACREGDNVEWSLRGVVVDLADYDWEGDRPLDRPLAESVLYEVHVGGFTRGAPVSAPGTFQALADRIPYLVDLGVTAVELMPAFQFDPSDATGANPLTGERLSNYWGYSPLAYFAPHAGYSASPERGGAVREFRDLVKALHRAEIEVIMDVVFHHTAEGNHLGPTMCFKGIDNAVYYTVAGSRQYYMDYSGCGNTLSCSHPVVDKLIRDCLTHWVRQMHVDGFRLDEGSVLTRGEDGAPLRHPPVIWNVELVEELANTKVIAEAWDAANLYQVSHFPGMRWGEWNVRFRDTIRRFVSGTPGILGEVANRLSGSSDLFQHPGRTPVHSLNFVTCHDGFTLADLVSYHEKHNEANGEHNQDGIENNLSWNCGVEGPSNDPKIEGLRDRQVKNYLALLFLAQGVPLLGMGDEVQRTQRGNNNSYCQDSPISWFDWTGVQEHQETLRFATEMIAFRRRHPAVHLARHFNGHRNAHGLQDLSWHGCLLDAPGWDDPVGRALAFTLGAVDDSGTDLHVIANMSDQALGFDLPPLLDRHWHRAVDTGLPQGADITEPGAEPLIEGDGYLATSRSVVVLISVAGE